MECQSHLPKHAFQLTMENVHICVRPKIVFGNSLCEIRGFHGRGYTQSLGPGTSCSLVGRWHNILEHFPHPQALGVSSRLVKNVATCLRDCRHHIPRDSLDPVELLV